MTLTPEQKEDAAKALKETFGNYVGSPWNGVKLNGVKFWPIINEILQSELAKVGLEIVSTSQLPLSAGQLISLANGNISVPPFRALATFADESNWTQLYESKSMKDGYTARACEWGFIGPVRPPFELAQWALKAIQPIEKEKE